MIVGYASYGPERSVASAASVGSGGGAKPGSLTPAGLAGETGELYTLYVIPAHWSTGVGRALTDAALDGLRAAGYRRVVLWTLTDERPRPPVLRQGRLRPRRRDQHPRRPGQRRGTTLRP